MKSFASNCLSESIAKFSVKLAQQKNRMDFEQSAMLAPHTRCTDAIIKWNCNPEYRHYGIECDEIRVYSGLANRPIVNHTKWQFSSDQTWKTCYLPFTVIWRLVAAAVVLPIFFCDKFYFHLYQRLSPAAILCAQCTQCTCAAWCKRLTNIMKYNHNHFVWTFWLQLSSRHSRPIHRRFSSIFTLFYYCYFDSGIYDTARRGVGSCFVSLFFPFISISWHRGDVARVGVTQF